MRHAVKIPPREDFRHPVDMAAHHVAAELVADLERALKVDVVPRPPLAERRHRKRFGADVERDGRTGLKRLDADDGQARAGIGDRGADGNRTPLVGARDPESLDLAGLRNINYLSDIADNSG